MKNASDTRLIAKAVYVWIFSITFGSAIYAIIFVLTHFDGKSFPIDLTFLKISANIVALFKINVLISELEVDPGTIPDPPRSLLASLLNFFSRN